ncbi:MAG: hypothetical protein E7637_02465 [Ruminococcaceae bacterium]|nr:hypothetical protein [Oscillospiraceae bacterium]
MNNIMDILPIIIIVIMVFILIGKFKGNGVTNSASENSYKTANDIYMRWSKDSIAAKIELAFSTIYLLGIILLVLYLGFGDKFGLEPLIDLKEMFDFKNKDDEEILAFLTNDLIKYVIWFLGAYMACGLIAMILGTNSFFDQAKWLSRNQVDCYAVLKNGNGNKTFNFLIGNGFLIKERPATKNIFYIRIGAQVVIDVLMILSVSKFLKSLISQTYEAFKVYGMKPGEWAKQVFTSSEALFFYAVVIASWSLNIGINRILRNKQAELLSSVPQNTNEE